MLTDKEVSISLSEKGISIDPFNPAHLGAGSYQVHLGPIILIPQPSLEIVNPLDPKTQPQYEKVDITDSPFILKPNMFILGQTNERIALESNYSAIIDGSSTLARIGLTIHQSSTFISPGQDLHIITLEIKNCGIWNILLTEGMKIGKLVFFKYRTKNSIPLKDSNQYNGQSETTGALFGSQDVLR